MLAILGSTSEYRDWAFREQLPAIVIDNSPTYHEAVSAELTHPSVSETVVFADWREMGLTDVDLVVGDLVVGQLPVDEIPLLLTRVRDALRPAGAFITKSFFQGQTKPTYEDLAAHCRGHSTYLGDIFPVIVYQLANYTVGADDVLLFEEMLEVVEELRRDGALTDTQAGRMREFGWDTSFKVHFTMPTTVVWESWLRKYFDDFERFVDPSVAWSRDLPTYIARVFDDR